MQHRAAHTNQCWVRYSDSRAVTGKLGKETALCSQGEILHLLSQVGTQGQGHTGFQKNRVWVPHIKSVVCSAWSPLATQPGKQAARWLLVKLSHGRHYRRTGKRRAPPCHALHEAAAVDANFVSWASGPFARPSSCHVVCEPSLCRTSD